jgi:hypothetical protein
MNAFELKLHFNTWTEWHTDGEKWECSCTKPDMKSDKTEHRMLLLIESKIMARTSDKLCSIVLKTDTRTECIWATQFSKQH